jgi:hypothetical protein
MKTFENHVKQYLVNGGFFENQAEQVFEVVKNAKENESMAGRWDDNIDDYPEVMARVVLLTTRRLALEWIDENAPRAWFRQLWQ